MMENRPVAAYVLSLIGAALQGLAAIFIIYRAVFFSSTVSNWGELNPEQMMPWMMGHWMTGYPYTRHPLLSIIWLIWAILIIVLGIYGAVMMNSTNVERVRMGSTLVLISSIIALPTMWGFMIGSLLMFVGSLLGLTWAPHPQPQPAQTV
jgi:hypothetical protein